ncbi:PHD finger protein 13-like isoform X2 [Ornithodoros turicata]|uniref:PHD finger protein 13-like isoform X2 n=1 Tax=Ornithodoros turicata TaxID=34597 RepID=UPI003139F002
MQQDIVLAGPSGSKGLIFKSERYSPSGDQPPPTKRQRTSEDFISFCKFILEYENYEAIKQEELRQKASSPSESSADSTDSGIKPLENGAAESGESRSDRTEEPLTSNMSDEDSHDLITCFCLKPFAGRPMIECSECLTWIHLSCAKIRRNNIPEEFTCQRCREAKHTTRRSQRIRGTSLSDVIPTRRRPST